MDAPYYVIEPSSTVRIEYVQKSAPVVAPQHVFSPARTVIRVQAKADQHASLWQLPSPTSSSVMAVHPAVPSGTKIAKATIPARTATKAVAAVVPARRIQLAEVRRPL
jgi:hypothetical protein